MNKNDKYYIEIFYTTCRQFFFFNFMQHDLNTLIWFLIREILFDNNVFSET